MRSFEDITVAFWLVFLLVWLVSAIGAKRNKHGISWLREAKIRIALIILVVAAQVTPLHRYLAAISAPSSHPAVAGIGVALCGTGVGLAILARAYLGRNWGMPMTVKLEPQLVSRGPYAFVRHPIYLGMLIATFGSALVMGIFWLFMAVLCLYFLYSAANEEKLMTKEFPDQYPAYKLRTKMLIPFVF
jgi:protein-S-isoprenylcysteine O-methyltransferase Ste14